jgi:hypothetical protein
MRSWKMMGDNIGALVAKVPIVRFGVVRDKGAPRVAMPRLRLKTITEHHCLCQYVDEPAVRVMRHVSRLPIAHIYIYIYIYIGYIRRRPCLVSSCSEQAANSTRNI